MRKILWFALGMGAACAFCAYGRMPVFLILPVLVILLACFSGEFRKFQMLLSVLGMVFGLFWFSRFEARPFYRLNICSNYSRSVPKKQEEILPRFQSAGNAVRELPSGSALRRSAVTGCRSP